MATHAPKPIRPKRRLSGLASDGLNDRNWGAKLTASFRALHWQLLSKADVHGSGLERQGLGRLLPEGSGTKQPIPFSWLNVRLCYEPTFIVCWIAVPHRLQLGRKGTFRSCRTSHESRLTVSVSRFEPYPALQKGTCG